MQACKRRMAEKAAIGEIEDTEVRFLSTIMYHLLFLLLQKNILSIYLCL